MLGYTENDEKRFNKMKKWSERAWLKKVKSERENYEHNKRIDEEREALYKIRNDKSRWRCGMTFEEILREERRCGN